MPHILHITPHLGGGVGKALLGLASGDTTNTHVILTLDYANAAALEYAKANSVPIFPEKHADPQCIADAVTCADIVVIHFWNHPLLYHLVVNQTLPPARIAFWSHVSGLFPPYTFPDRMLAYPDRFVFTTRKSCQADPVVRFEGSNKFHVIRSLGGVACAQTVGPQKKSGFVVGYVGTVDYAKMHPDYIQIHKSLTIPGIRFLIVGGDSERAVAAEADTRFTFTGKVPDVSPYMAQMDVFGYLLNRRHYGTAEQALQEAMAAGVVPVVLNNAAESDLVTHGKTGLVATTIEEYKQYITHLHTDAALRCELAKNAKEYAQKNFSSQRMLDEWNTVYDAMMTVPKRSRRYGVGPLSPFELFLESLGESRCLFEGQDERSIQTVLAQSEWQSFSKGSPRQYLAFFPLDRHLGELALLYD